MALTPHPREEDTFFVDEYEIACDGIGSGLGHPRVFLEVAHNGNIVCPYCSRKFIHAENTA